MPQNRRIYLLDPKKLSPETIAVTFAKTSRSPLPFDAIAEELSDASAADFHEKWVVGYGHSSVAEHAVLHIAVENISRLAVECLESNRLASYTEKSSRYQVWDSDHYAIPPEFQQSPTFEIYSGTCTKLFEAYGHAFTVISQQMEKDLERNPGESEKGFQARIRSACADVCRYFLPAGSLANVGLSINARALEHAISKMLSHPLREVQDIGQEIKENALKHVPTLVKYANQTPYLSSLNDLQPPSKSAEVQADAEIADWCSCIDHDADGEQKILAALLYRQGYSSMQDALMAISALDARGRSELANQLTEKMDRHDIPSREFELGQATFDLLLDQGAYFELKRHRMMTQIVQPFTPKLGYALPKKIETAGLGELFCEMMEEARETYETLAKTNVHAAAYVLPNAFNRRVLLQMNLRSAIHLIKLRCAENAHFAIRRPTLRMAEMLAERFPLFNGLLSPCSTETWKTVEKEFFMETQKF
jgi:thymidylate synthase ThyX